MELGEKALHKAGRFVVREVKKALTAQKHVNTKKLRGSVKYKIVAGVTARITHEKYGNYVDRGREIGEDWVPVSALMKWIRQKGIESDPKKVKGIAFAIRKTIKEEGIPTKGSKRKGKKTGWFTDTLERIGPEVINIMKQGTIEDVKVRFNNTIKEAKKSLAV